jgi:hypothetical protein
MTTPMPAQAQLFAPRPGQKPRTAFLATLGEILTFISEGRRSVAPSLLQPDLVQRGRGGIAGRNPLRDDPHKNGKPCLLVSTADAT